MFTPRRDGVSMRWRNSCGRMSPTRCAAPLVCPLTWQSKQVTPRCGRLPDRAPPRGARHAAGRIATASGYLTVMPSRPTGSGGPWMRSTVVTVVVPLYPPMATNASAAWAAVRKDRPWGSAGPADQVLVGTL